MSHQIGIDTINLRPTPRLAHTEYCSDAPLKRAVTGLPDDHPELEPRFHDLWDYDFIWSTDDGPEPWEQRGRMTDMGHSEFLENGVDVRLPQPCPFKSVEEALSFDAVAEYGLTDFDTLVGYYEGRYQRGRALFPEQVLSGGYYKTVVSGAIQALGWDMLLQAAAYPGRFARVLDGFLRQTMHHARAWTQTSIEVYMCHDDMVWSQGAFMHPDFYRAEIFPRYKALWSVLHEADKKVIFCSDGDWSAFVDDIVEAGADGLCFEPMLPLEPVVARYGQTHCIIGSKVDARTLTFGSKEEIQAEIDATLPLVMECPGFMFAVGNHIPSNVPVENGLFYMEYLREKWGR